MTKKEIAAKLREALVLMNDSGKHWIKGTYSEPLDWDEVDNPEYGYCSLGAIRYVTGTPMEDPSEDSTAVAFALAEVLPEQEFEISALEEAAFDRIVRWNDAVDRRWEEVVEKFNEAAARQES